MLVNGKPEELVKYSKGVYNKELFISKATESWELTDKQIRMTYLIADLAINGQGAFSVSNQKFREMFQKRFKMTISRSTVIRFFQLLEELGLLTVNEARRKNKKQSANIFIIEPIEIPDETPDDTVKDTLDEMHNLDSNKTINKSSNKPLKNNFVNKKDSNKNAIINQLTNEFRLKGMSKSLCLRVVDEALLKNSVENFGGYLRRCLENTLYKSKLKHGYIDPFERLKESIKEDNMPFFNWLEE